MIKVKDIAEYLQLSEETIKQQFHDENRSLSNLNDILDYIVDKKIRQLVDTNTINNWIFWGSPFS